MSMLRNKIAVVTGGTSGIGYAIARALGAAGAHVVIGARDQARGAAAVAQLGASGITADFVACDVRASASVARLVGNALERHGGLDIMVNNAGVEGPIAPLHEYPDTALRDVVDTNLVGVVHGMKHALPALLARGGGVIVNIASTIGTLVPFAGGVVYGGTKAAIVSMTAAVAAGYAEHGIRAYALEPWITDTPMIDRLTAGSAEGKAQFALLNPSGRIVTPADVAAQLLELISGAATYASGSAVVVDAPAPAAA